DGSGDVLSGMDVLQTLGNANSGSPQTLEDFVTWSAQQFPATRYALIVHGHGLAWEGFGWDSNFGQSHMTLEQFSEALQHARDAALGGNRFDLVMFDACLMGTIEVAAEMQPHADFLLTSENVEMASGQPYGQILPLITQHPGKGTAAIVA